MLYTAGAGGALPGLTPEETAILAGVLTGLALFLFLLLPILCCLCPACCGFGKKKGAASGGHREGNLQRYVTSGHMFLPVQTDLVLSTHIVT